DRTVTGVQTCALPISRNQFSGEVWRSNEACRDRSAAQNCRAQFQFSIQRSSVVERSAVNRLVVGSNPTAGAKTIRSRLPLSFVRSEERRVGKECRTWW